MSTTSDNGDDFDLPAPEDAVSTGAAADSADWNERLKGLPRLLRYAMLVVDGADHVEERLIAEVEELCPGYPITLHGPQADRLRPHWHSQLNWIGSLLRRMSQSLGVLPIASGS
ncbi:hypothetical protein [Bradyrhizobium sp. BR 1432]|uniref:hypothetical protein n=1 Tax=Bradyrhizobium sp. BR 1432 TaxID=3447966 RepID=UPI003EE78CC1